MNQSRIRQMPGAAGLAILALAFAMLAGASAAQASTWHIDGSPYTGKESLSWTGGPIEIHNPGWAATIACEDLTGSTETQEGKYSKGTLTLSSCAVEGVPDCVVNPLKLTVTGTLIGPDGGQAYERYSTSGTWTIQDKASGCALEGQYTVGGTIAAAIGPDAVTSTRSFTPLAETATKASGLQFYGDPWKVSGEAATSLAGANYGSEFGTGVGGTWTPEASAYWTLDGNEFTGYEEISWLGESISVVIENAAGTARIDCELSFSQGMFIHDGDQSGGSLYLDECAVDDAPKCYVNVMEIEFTGQLAFSDFIAERLEVDGYWYMSGSGCPFTGNAQVGGSLGAAVMPEGEGVVKMFEPWAEDATNATGLHVGNEYWHLSTTVESTSIYLLGVEIGS